MLKLSIIKGYSMSPSYLEGDYIVSITPRLVHLRIGDVITFQHASYGYLIKKIYQKKKTGYYVKGIHPMSTDSQTIGIVTPSMIKGKVILKIKQKNHE
jgi:signal peptidase I